MRMSRLFTRTLRERPAGSENAGYEFLLRAGYIQQLASGIFTSLPLSFRSLQKIEQIIREEMEQIGGLEIRMPVVNPAEIWKETGRWFSIDREMGRFQDRNDRDMVLAMTHEEAVTHMLQNQISSYKQLPGLVFQFQTKWRDDPRPRGGLLRVREFVMKDSYSFDKDFRGLEQQYNAHYEAYHRLFKRCGLPVETVLSDSGIMGGGKAHEFMYFSQVGEDTIITCKDCGYISNREAAVHRKEQFPEEPLNLELVKTPGTTTIEDLCHFLNIPPRKTAKAVFQTGTFVEKEKNCQELIVAVIRGDLEVEPAKLRKVSVAVELQAATEDEIRACGMEPGYGSPIGARNCRVIIDESVNGSGNLVAGANKPGYHYLNTNTPRDFTGKVADIASAAAGLSCSKCGNPLTEKRGVEVGHIFQLGTRYTEAMGCFYQDHQGKKKPVVMGSYGIGIGRLLACLAEEYHDEKGLTLPPSVAPWQVHLVNLLTDREKAEEIYNNLTAAGIEVLFDDRKESAGVKFNDADLIGLPVRLTLGNRTLKEGGVEVILRRTREKKFLPFDKIPEEIIIILDSMKAVGG